MKIVILDYATLGNLGDLIQLKELGELTTYEETPFDSISERIEGAEIVVTNKCVLTEKHFEKNPSLKLVCILATGTDNVDLLAAEKYGVTVKNVSGYSTNSVAQHTFACLFYLIHQLSHYDEYVKSGDYANSKIFTNISREYWELSGKKFGIIGLGNIGKKVAQVATVFGAEVIHYSTSGKNTNTEYPSVDLVDLLRQSDIVSIHAPLNEKTRGLIGEEQLNQMKPDSILINMGRGGIVNESELVKALNAGSISGTILDVLEKEPMKKTSPLFNVNDKNKLLVTPHIAWASKEARQKLIELTINNIHEYLKN